ncbi:hypothetical protein [Niveibacterium terrae]|uniref:hypothetical protein n=1 Tax=Niveibacterium terrae TaxID=3373598 RepID=UPI003A8CB267
MSRTFSAHGEYRFWRCGEVLAVEAAGTFNQEGASALFRDFRGFWLAQGSPSRWAYLIDVRRWEGSTPDAFELGKEMQFWCAEHGAQAFCRIHANTILDATFSRQIEIPTPVQQEKRVCSDLNEAWTWLKSRGFFCEDRSDRS